MSGTEPEIIIKGEIHTSNADLREEREILVEGVDQLILEGQAEEAEYSLTQQWYGWIMLIFKYLFARQIYVDHTILKDLAGVQEAQIEYTRETDLDILHNSHLLVQLFAVGLFFCPSHLLALRRNEWECLTGCHLVICEFSPATSCSTYPRIS